MTSTIRKYSSGSNTSSSHSSSRNTDSQHGSIIDAVAFSSQSTAPTSLSSGSPRLPDNKYVPTPSIRAGASVRPPPYHEAALFQPSRQAHEEDLSPSTLCYPRASVDTYVSCTDSEEELEQELSDAALDLEEDHDDTQHYHGASHRNTSHNDSIPPLPEYRQYIVDNSIRTSTPQEFAKLFPSLNRMSIRHDEFTADGNMNLRVDVAVPTGSRRRLTSYQLFHLRMYDLAKRDFSLRRYSRDSGREVCNSKLNFIDPSEKKSKISLVSRKSSEEANLKHWARSSHGSNSSSSHQVKTSPVDIRPALQRSVTTALRSLGAIAIKPSFRRSHSSGSSDHHRRPATSHSPYSNDYATNASRPSLSSSAPSFFAREKGRASSPPPQPKPTNTIKLEFSNYARVDISRRCGTGIAHDNVRYEFNWWDHKYAWKRSVDKHLNVVSYHLMRDGNGETAIAHIVPETRSPNQVDADEEAGGWIPPCHMWINDPSVLGVRTDVADVIMSTGLVSLADDCIRTRWQPRKTHGLAKPLISRTFDMDHVVPRALMHHVFHRRNSHSNGSNGAVNSHTSSPLRNAEPVH